MKKEPGWLLNTRQDHEDYFNARFEMDAAAERVCSRIVSATAFLILRPEVRKAYFDSGLKNL